MYYFYDSSGYFDEEGSKINYQEGNIIKQTKKLLEEES